MFPLPKNIKFEIFSYLSKKDLLNVGLTSKENYKLLFQTHSFFWTKVIKRDFALDKGRVYSSKEDYQIEQELLNEKEKFCFYMFLYLSKIIQIENPVDGDDYLQHLDPITKIHFKKLALEKEIYDLEHMTLESNGDLSQMKKNICDSAAPFQLEFINNLMNIFDYIFSELIDGNVTLDLKKITNDNHDLNAPRATDIFEQIELSHNFELNEQTKAELNKLINSYDFFIHLFRSLCVLDAHRAMTRLLDKSDLINGDKVSSKVLIHAFRYPCVNVIKALLHYDINVNEKGWIIHNKMTRESSPLVEAFMGQISDQCYHHDGLPKYMYIEKFSEIMRLLLKHGADNKTSFFMFEDGVPNVNDYHQKPFTEYLESIIKVMNEANSDNRDENQWFLNKKDRELFEKEVQDILSFSLEEKSKISCRLF